MEFLILAVLIGLNGLFAMTELAVVSARKARLQTLADEGSRRAHAALGLHTDPSRFLSTVQAGITLIGVSSGVVGESVVAEPLAAWLALEPALVAYSNEIALTVTIIGITYFSVVVGELVPKRLALIAPERIALAMAMPMVWLARLMRPLVWIFAVSSELVVHLLGAQRRTEAPVSNAEIETLMEQGAEAGVFHEREQELVGNILRLDEQRIGSIMTPRANLEFVDLNTAPSELAGNLLASPHSRIVACRDGLDRVVGVLTQVDVLKQAVVPERLVVEALEQCLREPLYVPRSVTTVHLLEQFRRARQQFALVVGEYGELVGVVTLTDVLRAIVGDLEPDRPAHERDIVRRADGSWLCDGGIALDRLNAELGLNAGQYGVEDEEEIHTLGGLVMHALGRVPHVTDSFASGRFRFEVIDMDGNRVDKVLLTPLAAPPAAAPVDDSADG